MSIFTPERISQLAESSVISTAARYAPRSPTSLLPVRISKPLTPRISLHSHRKRWRCGPCSWGVKSMQSKAAPQLDRLDRYVARSYVRLIEGASRARIAYSLEEALRLANLPGEVEGRIYCFRRVSLSGIAATANRRVWTEQVQQVLAAVAAQAIHGADPHAGASNAIFFNNLEEALEMLLRNALRRRGTEWAKPEWFSTSVLGFADETSYTQQIPAILERLRQPAKIGRAHV